ncbi:MAG: hypothetical protein AAGD11_13350 [Planctomycetota bacterium]
MPTANPVKDVVSVHVSPGQQAEAIGLWGVQAGFGRILRQRTYNASD